MKQEDPELQQVRKLGQAAAEHDDKDKEEDCEDFKKWCSTNAHPAPRFFQPKFSCIAAGHTRHNAFQESARSGPNTRYDSIYETGW